MDANRKLLIGGPSTLNGYARYWTGRTASGRQALLSYEWFGELDGLLVLWFDADGAFEGTQPLPLAVDECELNDSTEKTILRKLPNWLTDLGIELAPISIQPFDWLDDYDIFIRDLPRDLADHEDGEYGALYSEEQRAILDRAVEEWRESGSWVLVWGDSEFRFAADGSSRG
jgi:hypothetical protein